MNPEERKKFKEKCQQAHDIAYDTVVDLYGLMDRPDFHPAYKKIFEKALEQIMSERKAVDS